jgi:hypothetical protein
MWWSCRRATTTAEAACSADESVGSVTERAQGCVRGGSSASSLVPGWPGDDVELVRSRGDPVLDGAGGCVGGQRLVGDDEAAAHGGCRLREGPHGRAACQVVRTTRSGVPGAGRAGAGVVVSRGWSGRAPGGGRQRAAEPRPGQRRRRPCARCGGLGGAAGECVGAVASAIVLVAGVEPAAGEAHRLGLAARASSPASKAPRSSGAGLKQVLHVPAHDGEHRTSSIDGRVLPCPQGAHGAPASRGRPSTVHVRRRHRLTSRPLPAAWSRHGVRRAHGGARPRPGP